MKNTTKITFKNVNKDGSTNKITREDFKNYYDLKKINAPLHRITFLDRQARVNLEDSRHYMRDSIKAIRALSQLSPIKEQEVRIEVFNKNMNKTYTDTAYCKDNIKDKAALIKKLKKQIINDIQNDRQQRSNVVHNRSHYDSLSSRTVQLAVMAPTFEGERMPHVYAQPNSILKILKVRTIGEFFKTKTLTSNEHHVGVEIECVINMDRDTLAVELSEEGLSKYVCIKSDGSILTDGKGTAHELTIVAKQSEIFAVIEKTCKVLRKVGAMVNKSCGLHVHLDMRNRDHVKCYEQLFRSQNFLLAMNPAPRRSGRYSKPNVHSEFGRESDRYRVINCEAYRKFKTLEVRVHSATTNPVKINNWIKLLLSIINTTDEIKRAPSTVDKFIEKFKVDTNLAEYVKHRIELFKDETIVQENTDDKTT